MGLKISRYIRKSVISKFVITVQFCKALLGILLGSKKTSLYLRLRYIRVCTKGVLLFTGEMDDVLDRVCIVQCSRNIHRCTLIMVSVSSISDICLVIYTQVFQQERN